MTTENSTNKSDSFVSIVILASNLSDDAELKSLETASEFLKPRFNDYEIVIVGDWARALPSDRLDKALSRIPCVRYLKLAYDIDAEIAHTVGLENAIGDFVFLFNPIQDPINAIDDMFRMANSGTHVVVGVAQNARRSLAYRLSRPFANTVLRAIGYTLPKNATSFFGLSRAAIQAATKGRNYHHRLYMRIAQCGLPTKSHRYELLAPGEDKRKFFDALREILGLMVFNSTAPLRMMSILGFLGSFFAFAFATYSFLIKLIRDNVAEGWSSIVVIMSFLFMMLFIMLSFFGEYLSRLLNEQSRHEPYWIVDEVNSSVMLDVNRSNVSELVNIS